MREGLEMEEGLFSLHLWVIFMENGCMCYNLNFLRHISHTVEGELQRWLQLSSRKLKKHISHFHLWSDLLIKRDLIMRILYFVDLRWLVLFIRVISVILAKEAEIPNCWNEDWRDEEKFWKRKGLDLVSIWELGEGVEWNIKLRWGTQEEEQI